MQANVVRSRAAAARWTPRRKADLVAGIMAGEIDAGRACEEHGISPEELASWTQDYIRGGHKTHALRVSSCSEMRARRAAARQAAAQQ